VIISEQYYQHNCGAVIDKGQECPFHVSSSSLLSKRGETPAGHNGNSPPVLVQADGTGEKPAPPSASELKSGVARASEQAAPAEDNVGPAAQPGSGLSLGMVDPQLEAGLNRPSSKEQDKLVGIDSDAPAGVENKQSSLPIPGERGAGPVPTMPSLALAQIDETKGGDDETDRDSNRPPLSATPGGWSEPGIKERDQGMLWLERRTRIQQALALGTLAFVEAGRLLNQAREDCDWGKLGLQSWVEYIDDLGIDASRASRLQAIAHFVEEKGFPQEFVRMCGETRLYMASLAVKRGKMEEWELKQLPEVGCHQLRETLGYQEDRPFLYICSNCGITIDITCPKCHEGQIKRQRIAPAQNRD